MQLIFDHWKQGEKAIEVCRLFTNGELLTDGECHYRISAWGTVYNVGNGDHLSGAIEIGTNGRLEETS